MVPLLGLIVLRDRTLKKPCSITNLNKVHSRLVLQVGGISREGNLLNTPGGRMPTA